jgi:hypothetical protein
MSKETLEEAAEMYENTFNQPNGTESIDFIAGAEWQAKRMYSEEEVFNFLLLRNNYFNIEENLDNTKEWFEQFKKK